MSDRQQKIAEIVRRLGLAENYDRRDQAVVLHKALGIRISARTLERALSDLDRAYVCGRALYRTEDVLAKGLDMLDAGTRIVARAPRIRRGS